MTINYAKVKSICDELVSAGKPVTIDAVLSECDGSSSTVLAHYQRWRSEAQDTKKANTDTLNLSDEYMAAFQREIKRFSSVINRDFEGQLEQAIEAEKFAILALQKAEQIGEDLTAKVTTLEERLATETEQFKATIAEIEDNADAEIRALKEHNEAQIKEITDSKNQVIEEVKQSSESTIEQLKKSNEETIAELKHSSETTINELKQSGEAKVSELTETVTNQIKELEQAIQDKEATIQGLIQEKNQASSLVSELEQKASSSAQKVEQHNTELDDLRKAKEQMRSQLQQSEQSIEMLKKQNLEMSQHGQDQQNAVKAAKEQLQAMQEKLQVAEQASSSFEADKANMLKQMDFIKNNSTATIQRLTQNSDQNLAKIRMLEEKLTAEQSNSWKMENETEKLQEQLEFIKQNSSTTVERLTRSAEKAMSRVRDLERELDDTKLKLQAAEDGNNVVPLQNQQA